MLFITGATGHSGKWFLKYLSETTLYKDVKCVIRNEEKLESIKKMNLNLNIIPQFGDLENLDFLQESMEDCNTILHIASIYYSENIIKAAIKNNIEWCILVHTTGIFSKYKSASEEYSKIENSLEKYRNQIKITILRPTMIYGSDQDRNMIKLIDFLYRFKFFPMFGGGGNLMQPVLASDLARAYIQVIENKEKTKGNDYNLPGKTPIPYIQLIQTVGKILGRKTIIIKLPIGFSIFSAKLYNFLSPKPIISVEQVLRMQEDKAFDYQKAIYDFGYNPIDFETGIKEEIQIYLDKKGK